MARERIGRLPVVSRAQPRNVIGILTRSDLVGAHVRRLDEHHQRIATIERRTPRSARAVARGTS